MAVPQTNQLLRFNKPYGVLSQFTPEGRWHGLGEFIDIPGIYACGRLDADSEGLLLLTSDGALQARISSPRFKMEKLMWCKLKARPAMRNCRRCARVYTSTMAQRCLPEQGKSTSRSCCGNARPLYG